MMKRLLFLCAVTTWTFSSQDHHVGAFNFVQRQGDITRPLSINGRGQHAVFQISSSDFAEVDNQPQSKGTEESKSAETASIEDDVRSMRVKEIKSELHRLNISTVDAFEKEELVKRLVKARRMNDNNIHNNNAARQTSSSADASKSTEDKDTRSTWTSPSSSDKNTLVSPLYFTTVDAGRKTAGLQIQQGDKPYATIQINVLQSNSGSVDQSFPLQVLLDTACSGFVLRPSVIEQHNLPKLSTPVTMTGAGGTVGATGLTQIDTFTIETIASSSSSSSSLPTSGSSNADVPKNNVQTFGPMPAAVQDIGGLPNALDGIIGLSFLSQFSCVEMDFAQESVSFFGAGKEPPSQSKQRLLGRSTMNYISTLGLYSVDVYLGDKGPVKMLVDSGTSFQSFFLQTACACVDFIVLTKNAITHSTCLTFQVPRVRF